MPSAVIHKPCDDDERHQFTRDVDALRRQVPAIPAESCSEPDTSLLPVTNCPDVVILSAMFADLHWSAIASNDHRLDRMPFELEVSRRPNISRTGFA